MNAQQSDVRLGIFFNLSFPGSFTLGKLRYLVKIGTITSKKKTHLFTDLSIHKFPVFGGKEKLKMSTNKAMTQALNESDLTKGN